MSETTGHDDEKAAAEFTSQTRKRRILFALGAFGVGCIAVLGAAFLFGGQLQTSEKAQAGKARDDLRRRLDSFRPKCSGLWRAIYAIDFARIPREHAELLTRRLAASELSCQELADVAQALPQKPAAAPPAPPPAGSASAPVPIIRLGPGITLGPQKAKTGPTAGPASAPVPAPAPAK
jgi:hypothetical protein